MKRFISVASSSFALAVLVNPAAASNTVGVSAPPFGNGNTYPQVSPDACMKKGGDIVHLADDQKYCVFSEKDLHDAVQTCTNHMNHAADAKPCPAVALPAHHKLPGTTPATGVMQSSAKGAESHKP